MNKGRPSADSRPRKRRYLVVTSGEVTEPEYFRGLTDELGDIVVDVRPFREDPGVLAARAQKLIKGETQANGGARWRVSDGYRGTFVVVDVDDYTAKQFQEARRVCKEGGMELVLSNPCFEVWLVDHLACCPEAFSRTEDVERKAVELGVVCGSRNKHVAYDLIEGKSRQACKNAKAHNTSERKRKREQLNALDFGPWTDMPLVVKSLMG